MGAMGNPKMPVSRQPASQMPRGRVATVSPSSFPSGSEKSAQRALPSADLQHPVPLPTRPLPRGRGCTGGSGVLQSWCGEELHQQKVTGVSCPQRALPGTPSPAEWNPRGPQRLHRVASVFPLDHISLPTREETSAALTSERAQLLGPQQAGWAAIAMMCQVTAAALLWNICFHCGRWGPSGGGTTWGKETARLYLPGQGQRDSCSRTGCWGVYPMSWHSGH